MTSENFNNLLLNQTAINSSKTEALEFLVKQFPYAQSVRALYLKGLKQKESYKYNLELKTTAAYTTNRSVLFDYITSSQFSLTEDVEEKPSETSNYEEETKKTENTNHLIEVLDTNEAVLDPNLFEKKEENTKAEANKNTPEEKETTVLEDQKTQNTKIKSAEEQLEIGKPLEFGAEESHSFSEWLKLTQFKPIERNVISKASKANEKETTNKNPIDSKLSIIDKFIKNNPKIKPVTNQSPKPKSILESNTMSEGLMTETLARIYLEQKNYDKAIQSYKILSLKYPEKSSFFADQIKLIQEIKEQK